MFTRALPVALLLTSCSSGHDFGATDAGTTPETSMTTNACAQGYPAGPYGNSPGDVVNPSFAWQGYLPGASAVTTVTPGDLFDCDGSKGINAIVFDVAAEWCGACQSQAANMNALSSQDTMLGIDMVTLLVQDASQAPATTTTAQQWIQQYSLTDVTVCADPGFSFQPAGASMVQLPLTIVVNPRTMVIVQVTQGYVAAYPISPDPEAVAVAQENSKMNGS